jgi:hypothetical protein
MARRRLPSVLSLALVLQVVACGQGIPPRSSPDPRGTEEAGAAIERQRKDAARAQADQQREQERCLRERPELEVAMAELRRAESWLAQVKAETRVPLPPPPPWDEAAESRFRLEDRELDRQRDREARDEWRRREERDRIRWLAAHGERLREAQERLNRQARALRSRRADLFTGPGSIEFNPEVAARIRQCGMAEG